MNAKFIVVISFLIICSISLHVISFFHVSHALNFLCLLLLLFVSVVWVAYSEALWVYFVYVFAFSFAALSGFAIEYFELYMFEVREVGGLSGAVALTSSLMSFFLGVSFLVCAFFASFNVSAGRIKYFDGFFLSSFLFLAFVLVLVLCCVVLIYGSPLFMGVDRFTFWSEVAPPGVSKIRYFLVFMAFVVGYANLVGRISWSAAFFWLFLSIIALILNGEKLSGLVLLLYFYCLPYIIIGKLRVSFAKVIWWGGGASIFLVFVVMGNYFLIEGGLERAVDLFFARLALQGQMNYAIAALPNSFLDYSELVGAFFGIGTAEYDKGIYYFMHLIAPADIVERRLQQGTTFTAPFPGNLLYFFGYFYSLLVAGCVAVIVGFLSAAVVIALRAKNFLLAFVSVAASYYVYGAVVMGNMHKLFEWKFGLMVCFVGFMFVLGSGIRDSREGKDKMV